MQATAGSLAIPNLFSGYATFKRPPYGELEVFRACFEIIPQFVAKHAIDHTMMTPADEHQLRERYKIKVLDQYGGFAAKPLQGEVSLQTIRFSKESKKSFVLLTFIFLDTFRARAPYLDGKVGRIVGN